MKLADHLGSQWSRCTQARLTGGVQERTIFLAHAEGPKKTLVLGGFPELSAPPSALRKHNMLQTKRRQLTVALLVSAVAAGLSCRSKSNKSHPLAPTPDQVIAKPSVSDDGLLVAQKDAPDGLNFRISEGRAQTSRGVARSAIAAAKMSVADTNAVLFTSSGAGQIPRRSKEVRPSR